MSTRNPSDPARDPAPDAGATSSGTAGISVNLTRLIDDHHRVLFQYAYRLTGRAADAEDLTQQTLLIACRSGHQVRDPEKLRSWLLSVLRSCWHKSHRKASPVSAGAIELDVNHIPDDLPDDFVDGERLQQALQTLDDDQRLVLVMFYFEELSYQEIAEQLRLPMGTVMSRLSRAKGRLRQFLLAAERREAGSAEAERRERERPNPKRSSAAAVTP